MKKKCTKISIFFSVHLVTDFHNTFFFSTILLRNYIFNGTPEKQLSLLLTSTIFGAVRWGLDRARTNYFQSTLYLSLLYLYG